MKVNFIRSRSDFQNTMTSPGSPTTSQLLKSNLDSETTPIKSPQNCNTLNNRSSRHTNIITGEINSHSPSMKLRHDTIQRNKLTFRKKGITDLNNL